MSTHHRLHAIRDDRGSTLVVFLIILVVLVTIASFALQGAQLNTQSAGSFKFGRTSLYAAETGLDLGVRDIIDSYENLTPYGESVDIVGGNGFVTGPVLNNHNITYRITRPMDTFLYQTVVGNSIITHYAHPYIIEGHAETGSDGLGTEDLKEEIRILETPLVQYFVFYGGAGNAADLEFLPGPPMQSWGRIHANGDIYIGTNGNLTLRNYDCQDFAAGCTTGNISPWSISAGGLIYAQRKNDATAYNPSNVFVKVDEPNLVSTGTQVQIPTGGILTDAGEAPFNDYVLVNEQTLDAPNQTMFVRGGFYESRSQNPQDPAIDGMTITGTVGGGDLTITVARPALTDVTAQILAGTMPSGAPAITPPVRETSGTTYLCEERQGDRYVDFTDIDLYLLWQWYDDYLANSGLTRGEKGMLIYTSRSPNAAYTNDDARYQAIRLIKMRTPPIAQVGDETTLATDNPIYIEGDFNTINTRGVALVGDAINILSNAFASTAPKTCNSGIPNPSPTTIFAALFGGNVPTPSGGGTYSGGLENYPRFHENWGNDFDGGGPKTKTDMFITGAFINLWTSSQADGVWGQSNVYVPPNRYWGWDIRFNNTDFWPPFIPSVFSVERVGFVE